MVCVAIPGQQYITVSYKSPEELVKEVLIGSRNSSCITISNVSAKGWTDYGNNPFSYGYFEKGTLPFDIEKGIILSTGNVFNAPGPNTVLLDDQDVNWLGDSDLATALGKSPSEYLNATILEFDFVATNTTGISFQYMFLSEEYRPVNCTYSDAFAFLIKKAESSDPYENIALVPGTNDPVTSLTINSAQNCPRNTDYFGGFNPVRSPTAFDGQTRLLTAHTEIIAGVKYHIKLVIADHLAGTDASGRYDSAVFLKAGSFVGVKDLGPDQLLSSETALCEGSSMTLNAATSGANSYQWYRNGSILTSETSAVHEVTEPGFYEVEIDNGGCMLKGSVTIEYAEKPVFSLQNNFCNYNDGKPITVNLQELDKQIIANYEPHFKVKYYASKADAEAGNDNTIDTLTYTTEATVYVRAESARCTAKIEALHLITPQPSSTLQNETICAAATVVLKAESDYIYYKWLDETQQIIAEGAEENEIEVGIGNYSVELTSPNGCKLTQDVKVLAATPPVITRIDVVGNTATVFIQGGTPPYTVTNSWNDEILTDTNIFTHVPVGRHTVFVSDSLGCEMVQKDLLLLNIIKVITPNGDGKNDVLDYSDLKMKNDVQLEIFDRYGNKVYEACDQQFIWDGKRNGMPLPGATYWYTIRWTEPDSGTAVEYKGWILLKNRN